MFNKILNILFLVIFISGCGNTFRGLGKDLFRMGQGSKQILGLNCAGS